MTKKHKDVEKIKTNKALERVSVSSTTYRVHPNSYYIFHACYSIINRDQLSDYLIDKYYSSFEIPKRESINTGVFLQRMIEDFVEWFTKGNDCNKLCSNPKIIHLKLYFESKGYNDKTPKRLFPVRISYQTHQLVKKIAKEYSLTIGEVVEYSILYYLFRTSQTYYDLITFAIQYQFKFLQE